MQQRGIEIAEIAYHTYAINEYGLDTVFLLAGKERALLIDTGSGTFSIPEVIGELCGLPVTVALTHGHLDHAGGVGFFDKVYCHEDDHDMIRTMTAESRRGYAKQVLRSPSNPDAPVEDVVDFGGIPELLPLHEGDLFELGDRPVLVYETPGHTVGGVSFLDVRERILFTGDACNSNTLVMTQNGEPHPKRTIGVLRDTARKIKSLKPFYDRDYNGHVGQFNGGKFLPQAETIASDMEALCDGILAGTITGETSEFMSSGPALYATYGAAGVRYTQNAVK